MRELSLFTGGGGGLLGTKLLGFNHIGYVEKNEYCQKIIAQRIKDGYLDDAPIFGDIRAFISQGYAKSYQGLVDIITAGFPCQPFSCAGKGLGEADERNMWPETKDCIGIIRPRFAFLENVPNLIVYRYIQRIFGDLAEMGYDCRWGIIGADDAGAPHIRKRLWILATNAVRTRRGIQQELSEWENSPDIVDDGKEKVMANSNKTRLQIRQKDPGRGSEESRIKKGAAASRNGWWNSEPELGRVANGVARRLDRLKAIGNGQVPAVVKLAWESLNT